ncbi:uncharacterized protein PV07_07048 [Cladophialophora immunda]|uniref:Uncharacterized protein n=1 Tax=Cladophialophora immunda TaxID=569365 RepID=A0A0D2AQA7_9EURO|nr:uncharacterized protein PV07_07048 [Cladophialophora immunda]KIW27297.1 hypothetical protein PV07_07048 [Cladophialophora immunda]
MTCELHISQPVSPRANPFAAKFSVRSCATWLLVLHVEKQAAKPGRYAAGRSVPQPVVFVFRQYNHNYNVVLKSNILGPLLSRQLLCRGLEAKTPSSPCYHPRSRHPHLYWPHYVIDPHRILPRATTRLEKSPFPQINAYNLCGFSLYALSVAIASLETTKRSSIHSSTYFCCRSSLKTKA